MAETLQITIQQGDDFEWEITVLGEDNLPLDLTGCTVTGMGRLKYKDVLPAFTFTGTINPDQTLKKGLLTIELSDILSAALAPKDHVYDIELTTATGKKKKLYRGVVKIDPEATK